MKAGDVVRLRDPASSRYWRRLSDDATGVVVTHGRMGIWVNVRFFERPETMETCRVDELEIINPVN